MIKKKKLFPHTSHFGHPPALGVLYSSSQLCLPLIKLLIIILKNHLRFLEAREDTQNPRTKSNLSSETGAPNSFEALPGDSVSV